MPKDTTNKNVTTDIDNQSEDKKKSRSNNDAINTPTVEDDNDTYKKEQNKEYQYENLDGIVHSNEYVKEIAQKEQSHRQKSNSSLPLQERENNNYQPIISNDYQNHQQSFIMNSYAGPSVHTGGKIEERTFWEKIIGIFK